MEAQVLLSVLVELSPACGRCGINYFISEFTMSEEGWLSPFGCGGRTSAYLQICGCGGGGMHTPSPWSLSGPRACLQRPALQPPAPQPHQSVQPQPWQWLIQAAWRTWPGTDGLRPSEFRGCMHVNSGGEGFVKDATCTHASLGIWKPAFIVRPSWVFLQ